MNRLTITVPRTVDSTLIAPGPAAAVLLLDNARDVFSLVGSTTFTAGRLLLEVPGYIVQPPPAKPLTPADVAALQILSQGKANRAAKACDNAAVIAFLVKAWGNRALNATLSRYVSAKNQRPPKNPLALPAGIDANTLGALHRFTYKSLDLISECALMGKLAEITRYMDAGKPAPRKLTLSDLGYLEDITSATLDPDVQGDWLSQLRDCGALDGTLLGPHVDAIRACRATLTRLENRVQRELGERMRSGDLIGGIMRRDRAQHHRSPSVKDRLEEIRIGNIDHTATIVNDAAGRWWLSHIIDRYHKQPLGLSCISHSQAFRVQPQALLTHFGRAALARVWGDDLETRLQQCYAQVAQQFHLHADQSALALITNSASKQIEAGLDLVHVRLQPRDEDLRAAELWRAARINGQWSNPNAPPAMLCSEFTAESINAVFIELERLLRCELAAAGVHTRQRLLANPIDPLTLTETLHPGAVLRLLKQNAMLTPLPTLPVLTELLES